VRRFSLFGLVLGALLVASRLGESGLPALPAGGVRSATAASAVRQPYDLALGAPAARLRPEARALAAQLQGTLRAQSAKGQPAARAARSQLTATRLALLEQRGPLRRAGSRSVAGVDHTRFELSKRGLPFLDRGGRIHERGGRLLGVSGRSSFPPLEPKPRALARAAAIEAARAAAGVSLLLAQPRARLGWVAHAGHSLLAWEVTLASRAPLGDFRVWLDAADGAVLGLVDRMARYEAGTGVVFAVNPVNSKTPSDQLLAQLDGTGRLTGRITSVFDVATTEAFRPDLRFEFPVGDPRFVQTSIYRSLTDTGLLAEQHGFAIDTDVPAFTGLIDPFTGDALNNAFYAPSIPAFGFGNGDGTTLRNLGTDIDVAAHEYGHHVFDGLVEPLAFSSDDPVLAMAEGVADTFSLLVGGDKRVGNSVVPGSKALRTISSAAVYPDFFVPDPHLEGLVYAGVNSDLVRKLGAGPFTELLIASLPFLAPDPIETDYREAFLEGDQALFAGANQELLEKVFRKRGFDSAEPPPEFEGELVEGVDETRLLGNEDFDVFVFSELPPSQQVRFQTWGTGDVDLFVLPIDFDDTTPAMYSANFGSTEAITLHPFSFPISIDDADAWLVFVSDAPGGGGSSYTLAATATPRTDDIAIPGSASGFIADPDQQIDWFQFSGTAGQYVRVAVTATSGTIDPFVGVLRVEPFEVLDTDDDSGGGPVGLDALLQGVRLPITGLYVVGVLSLAADFDPLVGTGGYQLSLSLCDNSGGDSDGDGAHDLCDQDDDDDGFVDAEDGDPLDPTLCVDFDDDSCNDCSGGSYDFRNDGPDSDLDVICDAGDEDDDNDGCTDEIDPAPLAASEDSDLDFLGSDCDSCLEVPNPVQEDTDADGAGDACSVCARLDWQEPPSLPPDQNPAKASLQLSVKDGLGALRARGAFNPAGGGPLDPSASGVQVRLADANGALLDVFLPGTGAGPSCDAADGWTLKGTRFSYANRSGLLPPFCALGSAQGLTSLRITDDRLGKSGALLYRIDARNVPLGEGLANPARFVQLDLAFGEPPAAGQPSPEGADGVCAESVLRVGVAGTRCKISQKDGVLSKLSCTGP
jgi:hypothetical protein